MTSAARIAEVLAGRKVAAPHGGNYLVRCPAHEDSNPSLSVRETSRGVQVHCFAGCVAADVYHAIRHLDRKLLEPGHTAPEPAKGSIEHERRQHDKAAWLWAQRRPIGGTVAEQYLREARGITCPLPSTLAFLPPIKPEHHPAMLAAFAIPDEPEPGILGKPRDIGSVHLTLLRADGTGKADVAPSKLIIGSPGNRPIVLAPPNDGLAIAITEGIEDALSVHQATGLGAWAAGAAGFMPKLADVVLSYIECVTIFADADEAGRRGSAALTDRLHRRGIEVRLVPHRKYRKYSLQADGNFRRVV